MAPQAVGGFSFAPADKIDLLYDPSGTYSIGPVNVKAEIALPSTVPLNEMTILWDAVSTTTINTQSKPIVSGSGFSGTVNASGESSSYVVRVKGVKGTDTV